jgi:hypothetical protein
VSDLGTLHRRARELGPNISVVIAVRNLAMGVTVEARDVRVVSRPRASVQCSKIGHNDAKSGERDNDGGNPRQDGAR